MWLSLIGETRITLIATLLYCNVWPQVLPAPPDSIPIGVLLDHSNELETTGLRFAVMQQNVNQTLNADFGKFNTIIEHLAVSDSYNMTSSICNHMREGRFSLIGTTNQIALPAINSWTRAFHMPYLTTSPATSLGDGNFVVQMHPDYGRVIMELLDLYDVKRFYYIYDMGIGMTRLVTLYDILAERQLKITIRPRLLMNMADGHALLREIDKAEEAMRRKNKNQTNESNGQSVKTIVIDLDDIQKMQMMLQQIVEVGMNRNGYHYILYTLGVEELDLSTFLYGGANLTGFQIVNHKSKTVHKFLNEWTSLDSDTWKGAGSDIVPHKSALMVDLMDLYARAIVKIDKSNPLKLRYIFRRKILFNGDTVGVPCSMTPKPWTLGPDIYNALIGTEFEGLTGAVAFDKNGMRRNFRFDVKEVSLNRPLRKIGHWENGKLQLNYMLKNQTDDTFANNTFFRITSIISPPFLDYKRDSKTGKQILNDDGEYEFEGFCVEFAKKIMAILREKSPMYEKDYKIILVRDGQYGSEIPPEGSGIWNGMIGELMNRPGQPIMADMAIAPLTITSARERVVDFSKPFMETGISIMIKKPEKQKPGVFSFMNPFSDEIWMCTVVAYMGVSMVLFLVGRFSPYEWQVQNTPTGPVLGNDFTMANSHWFTLASFLNQGAEVSPRSASGRIASSCWWFFTLILISSYTANLAAFLTVERMVTKINDAEELESQKEVKYGTLGNGSTFDFFKKSTISVYNRMYNFMENNKKDVMVGSTEEGVKRVQNMKGQYAFLLESTMNEYWNQRKPCITMIVGDNLDSKGYGVATPLESVYKDDIEDAVLQLKEKGELQKLHNKWWYDKGECGGKDSGSKDSSKQNALTLSNVAGIFYILIGGLGLAMIVSVCEFLYKSYIEASRRRMSFAEVLRNNARLSVVAGVVGFHPELLTNEPAPEKKNGTVDDTINKAQYTYHYGGFSDSESNVTKYTEYDKRSHTQV